MTDDANAPTIPDTSAPTHAARASGTPVRSPDERYVLQTMLGSGGMGEVWLARDVRIARDIAIKMMRGAGDPDAVARFLREARVQGRLEHPGIVPVHDLGGDERAPYFAMKRLTGTTLADVIAKRGAEWTRRTLLARFVDICLAVEFAHRRGVIHRDLKPANIMLGDFGETYVLDWGLARIGDEADIASITTGDLRGDSTGGHTQAGAMLGTPGYMAPEQMRGEPVDHRADVFSLGCVLFEILAGVPAIPRDTTFEVTLASPCYRPATRAPGADIPPELDDACARATAADREQRFGSARELADAVQRFLDGDRDLERRRTLAAEHAARAVATFAVDTQETRAEAMREAGRAIALDPRNTDAQQLLARLLLQLPTTIPPAVRVKIDEERHAVGRTMMRAGRVGYLLFFLLVPLIKLLGVTTTWPLVAIDVLLASLILLLSHGLRRSAVPDGMYTLIVINHVALLSLVGVVTGPLFMLPTLLFGTMPLFLLMSAIRIPRLVILGHALAFVLPLGLELLHVVPSSFSFENNQLVLHPWAIDTTPSVNIIILLSVIVIQMVAVAYILLAHRDDQERRQELVHLQSWQLNQLVTPDAAAT